LLRGGGLVAIAFRDDHYAEVLDEERQAVHNPAISYENQRERALSLVHYIAILSYTMVLMTKTLAGSSRSAVSKLDLVKSYCIR